MLQMHSRPVPARADSLSLEELLALRYWPPAGNAKPAQLALQDGRHLSQVRGRGMEFDDIRLYQAGDDIRHLDWQLLARTGEHYTKLFREERERPAFLIADMGASMQFASRGHLKSLLAAYALALVGWAVQKSGDRVGGQLINACGKTVFYRPVSSVQSMTALFTTLVKAVGYKLRADTDLHQTIGQIDRLLPSGSQCYLFSDFRYIDKDLVNRLYRLARRCELQLVMLTDPLERELPKGEQLVFSGVNKEVYINTQDESVREQYSSQFQQRLLLFESLSQQPNISVHHWSTDSHPLFCQEGANE